MFSSGILRQVHAAGEVHDGQHYQDGSQPDAGAAAGTPTAMAVVSAARADDKQEEK